MKKIGLFFGTFNPIHVGHLIIANHIAEHGGLDEIWLVITPHNPHKQKSSLLPDYHRLEMAFLATESYEKIKPSDVEFSLPQPNYTTRTLIHLSEKCPNHEFTLIMGEDNLNTLNKWKNYQTILPDYQIVVYPRLTSTTIPEELVVQPNIRKVDAPSVETSSTLIRYSINDRQTIRPVLHNKVWEAIVHILFYREESAIKNIFLSFCIKIVTFVY